MKTKMQLLRASLMSTAQFPQRDRRRLQWLSPKLEEQRKIVMDALGDNHPLLPRMKRCGEVDRSNNMFYCGMPLCPRCFMRARGKQTKQAIKETFEGATNEDLAFATILLPARLELADVTEVIEKEKRRLRNFVERQRSQDARWDRFLLVGFWEMGRMKRSDLATAGRNTKLALEQLEFPADAGEDATVWLPHLHAIVHKGDLTEQEIAKALRNDGHSAPYQVDIQPLNPNRPVNINIKNLTRYSLKFRIEDIRPTRDPFDYVAAEKAELECEEARLWWPLEDVRAYAEWLRSELSGFQSLRFVLGPKAVKEKSVKTEKQSVATVGMPKSSKNIISHIDVLSQNESSSLVTYDVNSDDLFVPIDGLFVDNNNNNTLDTNWTDDAELSPPQIDFCIGAKHIKNTAASTPISASGLETVFERVHRILTYSQRPKSLGGEHGGN